jgi:hypothetical protein
MVCEYCGRNNDKKAEVCAGCGAALKKESKIKKIFSTKNKSVLYLSLTVFLFIFSIIYMIGCIHIAFQGYQVIGEVIGFGCLSIALFILAIIFFKLYRKNRKLAKKLF